MSDKEYGFEGAAFIAGLFIGAAIGCLTLLIGASGRITGDLATACNQVEKGAVWDGEKCVVTVTRKAGE